MKTNVRGMIEHNDIAITKIISAACRDFMAFRGFHNFEFKDGINSIVGGNASGKSSLIALIRQALSPQISSHRGSRWGGDFSGTSLVELKFMARGKTHYLRRVIQDSDHTTDLHLYIGEGEDGEVLANKIKGYQSPVSDSDAVLSSADCSSVSSSGSMTYTSPPPNIIIICVFWIF